MDANRFITADGKPIADTNGAAQLIMPNTAISPSPVTSDPEGSSATSANPATQRPIANTGNLAERSNQPMTVVDIQPQVNRDSSASPVGSLVVNASLPDRDHAGPGDEQPGSVDPGSEDETAAIEMVQQAIQQQFLGPRDEYNPGFQQFQDMQPPYLAPQQLPYDPRFSNSKFFNHPPILRTQPTSRPSNRAAIPNLHLTPDPTNNIKAFTQPPLLLFRPNTHSTISPDS